MTNKRWIPVVIILILALAVYLLKGFGKPGDGKKPANTRDKERQGVNDPVNRNRGFDRRTSFLEYSRHAACRMECREISKSEVETIMRDGKINYAKSDIRNARCPRYALEGNTGDGQRVRIVYAQCDQSTTVVTVIDLGEDHPCSCPGDDDKYKNRR